MKIVGVSVTEVADQRARSSSTNAVGSMSSCWTSVLRLEVAKKSESHGTCFSGEPTKKNCWSRSIDNLELLNVRSSSRPSQSDISQPMKSMGLLLIELASQSGSLAASLSNACSHSSRSSSWIAYWGV